MAGESANGVLTLERAFRLFCDLGCRTFQGVRIRVIGMDQTKWRKFCRLTKLVHGGFKDRDVAVVFANVRYPGSQIIDFEQFKIAIQLVAVKRKIPHEALKEYILKCAESLKVNEDLTVMGVGGRSVAAAAAQMHGKNHFGRDQMMPRGLKTLNATTTKSASQTYASSNSQAKDASFNKSSAMGALAVSGGGAAPGVGGGSNPSPVKDSNRSGAAVLGVTAAAVSPKKIANGGGGGGGGFSLTDFLTDRDKKQKASGEIDKINEALKQGQIGE